MNQSSTKVIALDIIYHSISQVQSSSLHICKRSEAIVLSKRFAQSIQSSQKIEFLQSNFYTRRPQRDIFRPKLFYNYLNLRLKNSQCTIKTKKFEEKKALIHLSPFSRKHIRYCFCDSWPLCGFLALCNLSRKKKIFNNLFVNELRKTFFTIFIF